ncbi:MAG: glycosyltransferase [Bacteroidota bacterium]
MGVADIYKLGRLARIGIVSDASYPAHTTNTQQVIKNASAFAMAGLDVELVIPMPLKQYFGSSKELVESIYQYYNVPPKLKIRVLRSIPASSLRWEKFSHLFASSLYSWIQKYDLIYTRNETLAIYCLLIGKPFIFEHYRRFGHEFPKGMRRVANLARNRALFGMVLHSELAAQSMEMAGISRDKILVLHNGYDSSDMEPRLSREEARKLLQLPQDRKLAVYAGNMQKGKSIETLIDLAVELPDTTFCLVGGTAEDLERLNAYSREKNANNVMLPGWQPIAEVSKYLYAADALLIPCTAAPLLQHGTTVLPFKIFPYLASGRAILAANTPDICEILSHKENAYLVTPDDAKAAAEGLGELLSNDALRSQIEENALSTSLSLTWERRAGRFKQWLAKMCAVPQTEATEELVK